MSTTTSNDDVPPTYTALKACSRGDTIRVNGKEYTVVATTEGIRNLLTPSAPIVLDDGEFRQLVYGVLPRPHSDKCGVMWKTTVTDADSLTPDHLLAEYDDVQVIEGEESNGLDLLPRTTEQTCPHCGHDSTEWVNGWRDGTHVESEYVCLGNDCEARFIRDRQMDPTDSATATVVDGDGEERQIELSGIYRETVTSNFKLDTRKNDDEEWYSATEIAQFLEMKAGAEQPKSERHGHVEPDGVRFGRGHKSDPTWVDDKYDTMMKVTFHPVT